MNEAPDGTPREILENMPEAPKEAQYGAPIEPSKDKGCRAGCLTVFTIVLFNIMVLFFYIHLSIAGAFEPAPSKPVIRHGEFPFRLEYEVNGEVKVVEDTMIFDYKGIKNDGSGKKRYWARTFTSGAMDAILLEVEVPVETWSGVPIEQTVRYPVGTGSYYMEGPYEDKGEENDSYRYAVVYSKFADGSRLESACYADELYENFKIRIISWEIAEPISNTFK